MLVLHTGVCGPQSLVTESDLHESLGLGEADLDALADAVPHAVLADGSRIYTADRVYTFFNAVKAANTAQPAYNE